MGRINNPLVSIIIPTYNRAHLIKETLESVITQIYINWECIVVDDGSTDNTEEIFKHYILKDKRIKFHKRPSNLPKGGNSCRNYGFELSNGEFIQWFDSDDLMLPNYISEKVNCFTDELDMVICTGFYWYPLTNEKKFYDLRIKNFLFYDFVFWKASVLTPSVLFKKEYLLGKELFNNKITRGQEFEFFSRLFFDLKQENFYLMNKPLFLYRQHLDSISLKDTVYIKSNKASMSFIALQNLERSIKIADIDLIKHHIYNILEYYFQSIENKHFENSFFIFFKFSRLLFRIKIIFFIEFVFWGSLLFILRKRSYKIEKRLRNYKI